METALIEPLLTNRNTYNNVALICRDRSTGKIKSIDLGKCHRRFFYFGEYVPDFKCGNPENIHKCEYLRTLEAETIRLIAPAIMHD